MLLGTLVTRSGVREGTRLGREGLARSTAAS